LVNPLTLAGLAVGVGLGTIFLGREIKLHKLGQAELTGLVTAVGVFPQIIRLVVAVLAQLAGQVLAQAGTLRALAALVNHLALL
jgi:hypothetical protein